jgi:hypothetical protein
VRKNRLAKTIPQFIKTPILLSFSLTIILLIVCLAFYPKLQAEIPFFYSVAEPQKQLAHKNFIFLFPSLSLIFNLVALILIKVFSQLEKIIVKFFVFMNLVFQIIIAMLVFRLILIIG